jgi:acetyl esterase
MDDPTPFAQTVRHLLSQVRRANFAPLHELPVAQARAAYAAAVGAMALPGAAVGRVEDFAMPLPGGPRPARLWSTAPRDALQAVLLYFHGGGFVVGGLNTCDALCRELARLSGAAVVALDYRKCPEHPLGAAMADGWDALQWLANQGHTLGLNGSRIAIGGDSAGGLLAATTALRARDAGLPLALQALFYPMVQNRQLTDSFRAFGDNTLLNRQLMAWFDRHCANPGLEAPWHREPLYAPRHDGLAPAWIGLAECDILTSEGQAYARTLREAGVPVTLREWPGMIHDFINMGRFLPDAAQAHQALARALATALGTQPPP